VAWLEQQETKTARNQQRVCSARAAAKQTVKYCCILQILTGLMQNIGDVLCKNIMRVAWNGHHKTALSSMEFKHYKVCIAAEPLTSGGPYIL